MALDQISTQHHLVSSCGAAYIAHMPLPFVVSDEDATRRRTDASAIALGRRLPGACRRNEKAAAGGSDAWPWRRINVDVGVGIDEYACLWSCELPLPETPSARRQPAVHAYLRVPAWAMGK